MASFIASALGFTFGFMMLPMLLPGARVRGTETAVKAGLLAGVLSAVLGKVLLVLLKLLLLPIALLGPLGVFLIQGIVNAILLHITARYIRGIEFDGLKTLGWAAVALTVLQTVVKMLA